MPIAEQTFIIEVSGDVSQPAVRLRLVLQGMFILDLTAMLALGLIKNDYSGPV
jgi:hypothetical protein